MPTKHNNRDRIVAPQPVRIGDTPYYTRPWRFLSGALKPRTPLSGLYLTGQDVASPGVTGAMMAGVMAAGAIEPRLLREL